MNSNKNMMANFIYRYSWNSSNNGLTDTIVKAFAVNGTIIYAGTADSGVYRSTNYGLSWQKMSSGLTGLNINSLVCMGSIIFAASDSGVFRSDDSAKTWMIGTNPSGGGGCNALAVKGTGIYGGTWSLYFSPDSAKTWAQKSFPIAGSINTISVFENTILLADRGTIKRSQDDGANWYTQFFLSYLSVQDFVRNANNIFAGSTSYGLLRSSDTGTTWTQIDTTILTSALTSYGTSIFAGGQTGIYPNYSPDIFISIDNGDHWFPQNNGLNVQAFAILNKTIFVGTNGQGGLFKGSLP
jgi:photosystem II stability/assembly factor-like uncharacterized protein